MPTKTWKGTEAEVETLRRRLEEAEETLQAIRSGNVDAVIVNGPGGQQIYSLKSADLPYRRLVEAMSEAALIISPTGIILHANGSFGSFLSRPMEKLLGAPLVDYATYEDRANLTGLIQRGSREPAHAELSFVDSGGNRLPAKVSVASMTMEGIPTLSVVVTDLRAREENREHVAARQRLTFLVEASRLLTSTLETPEMLDLIARLALNGIADWCAIDLLENGVLKRVSIAHRDPEKSDWAKDFVRDHSNPDEGYAALRAFKSGDSVLYPQITDQDVWVRNPNLELQTLVKTLGLASAMIVPMKARHETIGVISLVSSDPNHLYGEADLHMAESLAIRAGLALENSKLYREAKDAVRSREQFLSIASHELKTPLTTLRIQLQVALRKLRRQSKEEFRDLQTMVESAESQSQKLVGLIDRLLDLATIRSGKITLQRERVDLDEVLKSVLDRFKSQLEHSGTVLRIKSAPVTGDWDRMRVEQIVTNLLSNAIKFGSGRPVDVTVGRRNGTARFTVRDWGVGIEPEFLERIFQPFEQGRATAEVRGLGLGLYITHQLVQAHGGKISVDSKPGVGTQFTVDLPLKDAGTTGRRRKIEK